MLGECYLLGREFSVMAAKGVCRFSNRYNILIFTVVYSSLPVPLKMSCLSLAYWLADHIFSIPSLEALKSYFKSLVLG